VAVLFVVSLVVQNGGKNRLKLSLAVFKTWMLVPCAFILVFVATAAIAVVGSLQHGLYAHEERNQGSQMAGHFALYNEIWAEKVSHDATEVAVTLRLEGLRADEGGKARFKVILEQDAHTIAHEVYVGKSAEVVVISLDKIRIAPYKITLWTTHFYIPFLDFEQPNRDLRSASYEVSGEGSMFHSFDPRTVSVMPWYWIRIFGAK
jgi:hypothetical protein